MLGEALAAPRKSWPRRICQRSITPRPISALPNSCVSTLCPVRRSPSRGCCSLLICRKTWRTNGARSNRPGYVLWQPLLVEARDNQAAGALMLFVSKTGAQLKGALRSTWPPVPVMRCLHCAACSRLRGSLQATPTQSAADNDRHSVIGSGLAGSLRALWRRVEVVAKDPTWSQLRWTAWSNQWRWYPINGLSPGALLAQMEDAELSSEAAVAGKHCRLLQAELKTVQHSGFMDPRQKSRLAELEAQARLKEAQWQFAQGRLERSTISADRAGVAVLDNPHDWKGRPVRVGERILLVADPQQVEFKVMLPVKDSIALTLGAEVARASR